MNSTKYLSRQHYLTCFFFNLHLLLSQDHLIFSDVLTNRHTMMEFFSVCQPFNQSQCSKTIHITKLSCGRLKYLLRVEIFISTSYVVAPESRKESIRFRLFKVENILKDNLDSIPSPSPSVKIQIMCWKSCFRCKDKTLLGVVDKFLKTKKFVDITQQCLALLHQVNFPANNFDFC